MPTSRAFRSNATKSPSTITTAPSIIIPKSIAPIDKRLALIPIARRQIKAKRSANGIMIDTITVVRQSAMKINTMKVTSRIPSARLCVTVLTARSTRFSRSYNDTIGKSSGKAFCWISLILSFKAAITSPGFSPFRMTTMPCTTSSSSMRPTCPRRGRLDSCTVAKCLTRIGVPLIFFTTIFSISFTSLIKPIPRTT